MIPTQLAWHVARASGLVAYGLAAASVVWGLLVSNRLLGRKPPRCGSSTCTAVWAG